MLEICMKKNFRVGPVFASQIKKLRKRYSWVDQPLCRSGLTPISCAKLKIHLAHGHVDTGFQKKIYAVEFTVEYLHEKKIEGRTSLCLTDQEVQEEILLGGPAPL